MKLSPDLVIADRFRLKHLLGEGGMGSVWLADHLSLQIPCAMKFMRAEVAAEPAYRARFDREALAAARIRSPHVVQVLDHGVFEGTPYIAMEYLEGEDLAERLVRRGRLPPEELVAILAQVARALTKAHAAGLVHRDLKPPNIFLVRDDDREIVKVLDFGIAKSTTVTPDGQTRTGAVLGTPYYMSPEQAKGTKEVDHRTDLWALGVIAFECLTGALPFVSEAFGDLVLKIVVEPLPVPSQLAPVPAGFDAWWAKAVSREPAGRFQSAKEMVDALAAALGVRAPEGIGASTPSGLAGTGLAGTSRPPSPIPARSARATPGTLGPGATATATVSPLPGRDRARVLGALALIGIVVAGAVAALRSPAPPASGAGPQVRAASALVSAEVPAVAPAAPSAAPTAIPAATPTASASAASAPSASAASSAASTAEPAPTTAPGVHAPHAPGVTTSKPAAGKPAVAPAKGSGHDIGF